MRHINKSANSSKKVPWLKIPNEGDLSGNLNWHYLGSGDSCWNQCKMGWFLHRYFPSLTAPHLWNEQVTWRQLSARLLHLAVTLRLKGFQVVAALYHGFHLWLYLVDVETGDGELLLDCAGDLHRLETNEGEEEWEVSRNVAKIECRHVLGGGGSDLCNARDVESCILSDFCYTSRL